MSTQTTSPTEDVCRLGMRNAIFAQSFGCLGMLIFANGLLLLYMNKLGVEASRILIYLSFFNLFHCILMMPAAYFADRIGKKRVGVIGLLTGTAGMACIPLAAFLPVGKEVLLVAAIIVFSVGGSALTAGWFALLQPLVPENERGRFFGRMRVSWQIVGVIFAGICGLFLGNDSPLWIFQIMLAAVTVGLVLRVMFYRRIPEIEPPVKRKESFMTALGAVVRTPNYASFCAYIFLLMTFTSGVIALFAMVEKNIMGLGDGQVVLLANLGMIGATAGFYLGGKAVDRHGTKTVFLICHFAFGLITALFLFRGLAPQGETFLMIILGTLHFMFGSVGASSSIAISTEMLALLPEENKSLAASMCSMLQSGGRALSGILAAWIIQTGMLKDEWSLWGQDLCKYDSVLVIYAGMIVLLVVALGLVPSVLRKAEWRPIN